MAEMGEDERGEELSALTAIFPELVIDQNDPFSATLDLPVAPSKPLLVRFVPDRAISDDSSLACGSDLSAHIEHDIHISHLPPLQLQLTLPEGYPADQSLVVGVSTQNDWLPKQKIVDLEKEASKLWEEYGRGQTAFVYIDYLQQAGENGFDLDQSSEGLLILPVSLEKDLVEFDAQTKLGKFREGTYDCGICLEPKKGSVCHQMERCGHVFCLQCLHDFYNNAITEGDVAKVTCLDPECDKDGMRKRNQKRPIHPRELLLMGMGEDMVRRLVEMKRKKQMESDKNTVFCPRTWCQAPARSPRYPPIPKDLSQYVAADELSENESELQPTEGSRRTGKKDSRSPAISTDRLAVCEKCSFAFCRVCYSGWHGDYQGCLPRNPNELSAEEKASHDYILRNTTPCPTCGSPTQKTYGCNHMQCFQCSHHFCYLCSSWLHAGNPYKHFNTPGHGCYQRLFELDEGNEGPGPADGRGFEGGRHDQMALEVAREAEQQEAEAAELALVPAPIAEVERAGAGPFRPRPQPARQINPPDPLEMARLHDELMRWVEAEHRLLHEEQRRAGLQGDPVNARGQAPNQDQDRRRGRERERGRERGRGRGRGRGQGRGRGGAVINGGGNDGRAARGQDGPAFNHGEEIQRFLRLAQMDEEDEWDSDELGEDDERFVIR